MKTILRVFAGVLCLGAIGYWAAAGANRGWTKTRVPVKTLDEVTGIEGVTYHKQFVPGVDFLAVAGAGAAVLVAVSFLFRTKQTRRASNEQTR